MVSFRNGAMKARCTLYSVHAANIATNNFVIFVNIIGG